MAKRHKRLGGVSFNTDAFSVEHGTIVYLLLIRVAWFGRSGFGIDVSLGEGIE